MVPLYDTLQNVCVVAGTKYITEVMPIEMLVELLVTLSLWEGLNNNEFRIK